MFNFIKHFILTAVRGMKNPKTLPKKSNTNTTLIDIIDILMVITVVGPSPHPSPLSRGHR